MEDPLRLRTRTGQDRPVCEQAAPGLLTATAAPPGAAGMHGWVTDVIGAIGAPQTSAEEYLDVFFARSPGGRPAQPQKPPRCPPGEGGEAISTEPAPSARPST